MYVGCTQQLGNVEIVSLCLLHLNDNVAPATNVLAVEAGVGGGE